MYTVSLPSPNLRVCAFSTQPTVTCGYSQATNIQATRSNAAADIETRKRSLREHTHTHPPGISQERVGSSGGRVSLLAFFFFVPNGRLHFPNSQHSNQFHLDYLDFTLTPYSALLNCSLLPTHNENLRLDFFVSPLSRFSHFISSFFSSPSLPKLCQSPHISCQESVAI